MKVAIIVITSVPILVTANVSIVFFEKVVIAKAGNNVAAAEERFISQESLIGLLNKQAVAELQQNRRAPPLARILEESSRKGKSNEL